jgi:hypothetical protein
MLHAVPAYLLSAVSGWRVWLLLIDIRMMIAGTIFDRQYIAASSG